MLASTLGIELDPDAAWYERRRVYETSGLIIDSKSITAFAQGDRTGLWTCAVAAAVFRFEVPSGLHQVGRAIWVARQPHSVLGDVGFASQCRKR
jgi:hypothetical protein